MYVLVTSTTQLMLLIVVGLVHARPQLRAEDLEPFLDNPEALKEFGQLIAAEIRFVPYVFTCHKVQHLISAFLAVGRFCMTQQ